MFGDFLILLSDCGVCHLQSTAQALIELHNTATWWGSNAVISTGKHFSTGKHVFTGKLIVIFFVVIVARVKFNITPDKTGN